VVVLLMKRKTRYKLETGSYFLEVFLELLMYVPRLLIRMFRWLLD